MHRRIHRREIIGECHVINKSHSCGGEKMHVKPPVLDNEPVTPWHWRIAKPYAFKLYQSPELDLKVFVIGFHEEMN